MKGDNWDGSRMEAVLAGFQNPKKPVETLPKRCFNLKCSANDLTHSGYCRNPGNVDSCVNFKEKVND